MRKHFLKTPKKNEREYFFVTSLIGSRRDQSTIAIGYRHSRYSGGECCFIARQGSWFGYKPRTDAKSHTLFNLIICLIA
jgi:hypothetical protein